MADKQKPKEKLPQPNGIEDGIGIRLKAARESKGLSQSDLHNKTGLSRTVLINYEAGRHKPGARELRLVCDALEVSPNHLIYGTEDPHRRSIGLADTLLSMGEAAIIPAAMLVPMCGAMLGQDDTRTILNLVESLLKAKDPVGYAHVMELAGKFNKFTKLEPEERSKQSLELLSGEDAAEKFKQELVEKIKKRAKANDNQGKS